MVETFTGLWKTVEASRVVGTVWSNDPDGQALSNKQVGLPPGFEKAGFKVVDIGMFTPLSSDFTAQITKLKAEKCEIVTGVFLPPDWATFWAQCAQQGYKPKVATIAKALLFPSSVEALGDRGGHAAGRKRHDHRDRLVGPVGLGMPQAGGAQQGCGKRKLAPNHARASSAKWFVKRPMPSISIVTSSPAVSQRCGFMPMPTPAGVPVAMMSPG